MSEWAAHDGRSERLGGFGALLTGSAQEAVSVNEPDNSASQDISSLPPPALAYVHSPEREELPAASSVDVPNSAASVTVEGSGDGSPVLTPSEPLVESTSCPCTSTSQLPGDPALWGPVTEQLREEAIYRGPAAFQNRAAKYPTLLWGCLGDDAASVPQLRRQKRDWVVPTKMLFENYVYPPNQYVARIRSDWDSERNLHYTLLGPGASKEPVNLFVVDDISGLVYVRGTLDREERETYILTGVATFSNGSTAENRIDLRFDVEDDNDNPPVFVPVPPATVQESSPPGTLVGRITATDADKANCSHSKIAYSLVKQEPSDGRNVFYIDRETGSIYVKENTLDRETQSSYTLTVEGTDMDGAPGGNTGTGTIHVKVVDINDNVPELEKDEYAGSIMENTAQVEVMRFKVLDDDEEKSDNWLAVFDIVTGNEDGIFSIKTDPKTNEGVLMLEKPVDFEENPDIKLGVVVSNVAPAIGDGDDDGDGQGGGDFKSVVAGCV
ncbi:cadherin-4-like [Epinephelus moara]|uniref:cadherin-4-like n=1 Tax=Epinephelus moara TaxID=300413 RepID=UPI00214EB3B2|nr:cadherin-4-like [Epinephelus moara]